MLHQRVHDYPYLIRRWRGLSGRAGLRVRKYAESGGYDLFYLESRKPDQSKGPAVYLSAGIHGDEAGATEGLLEWAEKQGSAINDMKVLIFPCLNPWGLVNNSRFDVKGRDLNRGFRVGEIPQIAAQKKVLTGRRFDLAMTLHEDYDARGLYVYEAAGPNPSWGEKILAAEKRIPADPRKRIEGMSAKGGVIRSAMTPDLMPDWPEAFPLHFSHATRTFTTETPSEYSVDHRAMAHRRMVARAVSLSRKAPRISGRTTGTTDQV